MEQQTVCGLVTAVKQTTIMVEVRRESACAGCQASGVCHSLSKPEMIFELEAPVQPVKPGDRVVIALSGNSFLKACLVAFGIPLAAVLTSLLIAHLNGVSSDTQVWVAVAAFIAGLAPVRIIGRNFATPKIIEVLHEQG